MERVSVLLRLCFSNDITEKRISIRLWTLFITRHGCNQEQIRRSVQSPVDRIKTVK